MAPYNFIMMCACICILQKKHISTLHIYVCIIHIYIFMYHMIFITSAHRSVYVYIYT